MQGTANSKGIGNQMKKNIKNFTRTGIEKLFLANDLKKFHATQLFEWLYKKRIENFSEMTNLSKSLRSYLEDNFSISSLKLKDRLTSSDGTEKYLFELDDERIIETVLIPETSRKTLCVSTQVGCKRKCSFCVSGNGGFIRNLKPSEIVDQLLKANELIAPNKISNLVFMGIGEPLDNYDNLIKAINILRDEKGIYLGKRKISISTCGVVPGIERLIEDRIGVRLSISLHSADDETRSKIMPVNRKYPLAELMKSIKKFTKVEGFPVFFEYTMIKDLNSSKEDAYDLARSLKGFNSKVNLIRYNPSPYFKWKAPEEEDVISFRKTLKENGIFFTLRKSRGQDINAACGQLSADNSKETK